MSVGELIKQLQKIEDKSKPVMVYLCNEHNYGDNIFNICEVDFSIEDRVDINCVPCGETENDMEKR